MRLCLKFGSEEELQDVKLYMYIDFSVHLIPTLNKIPFADYPTITRRLYNYK